jgi:Putative zinc-finger
MDCDVWQDKIDAFVDSELSAGQGSAFEEHLRICPACSLETLWRQRLKVERGVRKLRSVPDQPEAQRDHLAARSCQRGGRAFGCVGGWDYLETKCCAATPGGTACGPTRGHNGQQQSRGRTFNRFTHGQAVVLRQGAV